MYATQHKTTYGIPGNLELSEISDSFSITRDGLHIEVVKSDHSYQFKIFDLMSTELLQEGELKDTT